MYKEIIFTDKTATAYCAYAGGGAFLPEDIAWPCDESGAPLMHLMAFPRSWIDDRASADLWISIFIPFVPDDVKHYRLLRCRDGSSSARVIAYRAAPASRNAWTLLGFAPKRIDIVPNDEPDDDDNLASKLLGIPAWLQDPIVLDGYACVLQLYGGDLDASFPSARGILSDGMGYLFLSNGPMDEHAEHEAGKFFLQLG